MASYPKQPFFLGGLAGALCATRWREGNWGEESMQLLLLCLGCVASQDSAESLKPLMCQDN